MVSSRNFEHCRQCTYNVTLWHVRVTIVAVGTQQCILLVLLRHVSLSAIQKILSVAQQYFYGKYMLPVTRERTYVFV